MTEVVPTMCSDPELLGSIRFLMILGLLMLGGLLFWEYSSWMGAQLKKYEETKKDE